MCFLKLPQMQIWTEIISSLHSPILSHQIVQYAPAKKKWEKLGLLLFKFSISLTGSNNQFLKRHIRIFTIFWPIRSKFSVSFIFDCFFRKKQSDWLKKSWKFRICTNFGIGCWIRWAKYLRISLPMKKESVFPQLRPFYAHLFGTWVGVGTSIFGFWCSRNP